MPAVDVRQVGRKPYQMIAPDRGLGAGQPSGLRQQFPNLVPRRPYCSDDLDFGLKIRARKQALKHRLIQLNSPQLYAWLPFDIDRCDAYYAADDANLPPPNFIATNRANGRAHVAYLLNTPVHNFAASRTSPLHFLAAIERGLRRRLDSDPGYVGLIVKNPLHAEWRVEWQAPQAYELDELEGWLFPADMRPEPKARQRAGIGRNCTIFDDVRAIAYSEVIRFKRRGGSEPHWVQRCIDLAAGANRQFEGGRPGPLGCGDIRAIGKSIGRWTWRKFTDATFSQRQSWRGSRMRKATKQRMAIVEALRHGT